MAIFVRSLAIVGLTIALLATAAPRAHAADLSGNWDALAVEQCDANIFGAVCGKILPSTSYRTVIGFHATCDATGSCNFTEAIAYFSNSLGQPSCSVAGFTSTSFSGSCSIVFSGKASIKQSKIGLPTFVATQENLSFYGNPFGTLPPFTIPSPTPLPFDTGVPAVVGTYLNTTQNLQLLGDLPAGASAPPGITAIVSISQTPAGSPPAVLSLPLPSSSANGGVSGGFVVGWYGGTGAGLVNFGTSCSGLVGTSLSDLVPNGPEHLVVVSGNDLPGSIGDIGVAPGGSYVFQAATSGQSGQTVLNNGGKCYSLPTS